MMINIKTEITDRKYEPFLKGDKIGLYWVPAQPDEMKSELSYICIDDGEETYCTYLGDFTYKEAIRDFKDDYVSMTYEEALKEYKDGHITSEELNNERRLDIIVHLVLVDGIDIVER